MKHLQLKYNLLHIFFWMTYCALYAYVAVLLQYKGMSNTMVGLTTGIGSALTIVTTPWVSGLIGRVPGLSIRRLITGNYVMEVILWTALIVLPVPPIVLMLLFIVSANLIASNVPLMTTICMNYLTDGYRVNFGLSRGLGSVSYAASAVVFGVLIEWFDPRVLGVMFALGSVGMFAVVAMLPEAAHKELGGRQKNISMLEFIRTYRIYLLLLCAVALQFSAATSLSTYLINIVLDLGGTTSLYGVAIFFMAASELPFMALTPWLKDKFSTEGLLLFAAIMYVARNGTITSAGSLPVLFFGMALQGASYGIFTATITYYVHERIALEHGMMGQTMIAVMTTGVGSTFGNVLGGVLQDRFGLQAMLFYCKWVTVAGLAMFVVVMLYEKRKREAEQ